MNLLGFLLNTNIANKNKSEHKHLILKQEKNIILEEKWLRTCTLDNLTRKKGLETYFYDNLKKKKKNIVNQ